MLSLTYQDSTQLCCNLVEFTDKVSVTFIESRCPTELNVENIACKRINKARMTIFSLKQWLF